ncbi:MAG TPA: gas vesicle protein GvpD P-loop domain-containing protein [Thermoplasmata archaeon]|nr:gas vesicle protein GvpD P-loop domain-containing protein [Thermoplasmata archaeon]
MSVAVRLPAELSEFLRLPGPQTLLIRGPPGSGKSTLCLALLEASIGEKVLVTNRVSARELHREFPWLGENGSKGIELVDASSVEDHTTEALRAATQSAMVAAETSKEARGLEEFLRLPLPIQDAWSRLPSASPATVVLDSWDALVEQHLGALRSQTPESRDREEVERMLLRQMGKSRAHLVIVLEREELSQLDYLVNGVVVTRREMVNDRLERWLQLPKLRGIRIEHASYPYTVEGAKFQCIEPARLDGFGRAVSFDPEPDPAPGYLWPGSRSFAGIFGRFPLSKFSLIETDNDVPESVRHRLIAPALAHTVSRGGRVVLLPPPTLSADEIWGPLDRATDSERLSETLRVIDLDGSLARAAKEREKGHARTIVPVSALVPSSPSADPQNSELIRWVTGGVPGGHPGMILMYATGLEGIARALKIPITSEVAASIPGTIQGSVGRASNLAIVGIGPVEGPLFAPMHSMAAVRLRLQSRQGRVFIYGVKPWTTGLVLSEGSGSAPYELLRIV